MCKKNPKKKYKKNSIRINFLCIRYLESEFLFNDIPNHSLIYLYFYNNDDVIFMNTDYDFDKKYNGNIFHLFKKFKINICLVLFEYNLLENIKVQTMKSYKKHI